MITATTIRLKSLTPVKTDKLTKSELKDYFENTWELYEILFSSIKEDNTLYVSPDPLRNPLIFYLGHTAAFYINKLVLGGILKQGLNPYFEEIFAKGVDPDKSENLDVMDLWPTVSDVRGYREAVYHILLEVIERNALDLPITDTHPLWALMMGIEHDRIHFETSSVLIRQLPEHLVERPETWLYAPSYGQPQENKLVKVPAGKVTIGKPKTVPAFGWDNEYGQLEVEVKPFAVMKNLVTNEDFLAFVQAGGYENKSFWTTEAWNWKIETETSHPKFWMPEGKIFRYRAMFDVLNMPLDWPAEVNAYEAEAFCRWKGEGWRLMTEAEFHLVSIDALVVEQDPIFENKCNLNLFFGSPTPVGYMKDACNPYGFSDLFGNVWDWLRDDFYPLPGFEPHPLYEDFSAPYMDKDHGMMSGGSWATTGTGASRYYRLWFRRYFFQHAGFRLAKNQI